MEEVRMLRHFLDMPNINHATKIVKRHGLKGCGLSDEEAEKLCEPKPLDREQVIREVAELAKAHQKEYEKEEPQM